MTATRETEQTTTSGRTYPASSGGSNAASQSAEPGHRRVLSRSSWLTIAAVGAVAVTTVTGVWGTPGLIIALVVLVVLVLLWYLGRLIALVWAARKLAKAAKGKQPRQKRERRARQPGRIRNAVNRARSGPGGAGRRPGRGSGLGGSGRGPGGRARNAGKRARAAAGGLPKRARAAAQRAKSRMPRPGRSRANGGPGGHGPGRGPGGGTRGPGRGPKGPGNRRGGKLNPLNWFGGGGGTKRPKGKGPKGRNTPSTSRSNGSGRGRRGGKLNPLNWFGGGGGKRPKGSGGGSGSGSGSGSGGGSGRNKNGGSGGSGSGKRRAWYNPMRWARVIGTGLAKSHRKNLPAAGQSKPGPAQGKGTNTAPGRGPRRGLLRRRTRGGTDPASQPTRRPRASQVAQDVITAALHPTTEGTDSVPAAPGVVTKTDAPTRRTTAGTTRGGMNEMATNPFAAVIEALSASQLDPHNARRVQEWYEGMPEFVSAVQAMFDRHSSALEEEFFMDPAPAQYAKGLGAVFGRFHEPVTNAGALFGSAHRDDLDKINNPQRNQEKWDISANQE